MKMKPNTTVILLFLIAVVILTACGEGRRFSDLRYDDPSAYYLHVPEGYTESMRWPLFIALHEPREDSQDCIAEWFEIADENEFFLLCPELSGEDGNLEQAMNERLLAVILTRIYQEYSLHNRFFLAGRSEAASFAMRYAYRYPEAIQGVSVVDATSYPSGVDTVSFPILIIVEQGDQEAITAGNAFIDNLGGAGSQTRLLQIDDLGNGIPYRVQRLTVDLFEQVSR